MNLNIKIVTLSVSRWEEYKKIRLEALESEAQAFGAKHAEAIDKPDEEWISRVEAAKSEDKDIMLFAEDKDHLVGMIGAYFSKEINEKDVANIWGVYLNKDYRGMGIGQALLEAIVEKLKAVPGLKSITLMVNQTQTSAVGLYEKLGFKILRTEKAILGDGKEHDEYVMELKLVEDNRF